MRLSRAQVLTSGLVVVVIAGIALSAIALSRTAARGARPAVTYTSENPADWRVVDPDGANGRERPGFAGEIAHRLAFGEIVAATGRVADVQDESWREVRLPGGDTVWIRAALLGDVDGGDVTPPVPTTVPTTPPVTTPPATTSTTVPPAPVFDSERPGVWDVTGIAEGGYLNVRSRPGTAAEIVARLEHDTTGIASTGRIATVASSLWREVEYRAGRTGWVSTAFLEAHVPVPVFGTEKPGRWNVTGLAVDDSLNVRSGPGTANAVVARLAHDAVDVASTGRTATVSGSNWREVRYDAAGKTGWVNARYLTSHVPKPDPPAATGPPRGIAVMGDWNGNGIPTPGIFHNGVWHLRLSSSAGPADLVFTFGESGDRPVVGDWNGDGTDTPGVVRGGAWRLRNSNSSGPADLSFTFGDAGDTPVAGDWNGDGTDTPGVVRGGAWHLRNSNSSGPADLSFTFGDPGDTPVAGDWDGNGTDTPGVVRGDRWLLSNEAAAGAAGIEFRFGDPSGSAVTGDWNGDGFDTVGIVSGSTWRLRNQLSAGSPDLTVTY